MKHYLIILLFTLQIINCNDSRETEDSRHSSNCRFIDYKQSNEIHNLGYRFSVKMLNSRIGYNSLTVVKEIDDFFDEDSFSKIIFDKTIEIEIKKFDENSNHPFIINQWCFDTEDSATDFFNNVNKLKKGDVNRLFPINWVFIKCESLIIQISSEFYHVDEKEMKETINAILRILSCENALINSYSN